MNWLNVEIKARCLELDKIEETLLEEGADYKGEDHQIDTYFKVPEGRLKLREGNIERALIHYHRDNQTGPKNSVVTYYKPNVSEDLKKVLSVALGVKIIVDKKRKIFFIDNVKFHLDRVAGLGTFVEIEAIDTEGKLNQAALLQQCQDYMQMLEVQNEDLIAVSYSDLLESQAVQK